MKSLEWQGPLTVASSHDTLKALQDQFEQGCIQAARFEWHADFRRWQDAVEMNMIFGDNYVTVPPIPPGYEDYAKWWRDNQLKAYK